jgi:hypothetical protein
MQISVVPCSTTTVPVGVPVLPGGAVTLTAKTVPPSFPYGVLEGLMVSAVVGLPDWLMTSGVLALDDGA